MALTIVLLILLGLCSIGIGLLALSNMRLITHIESLNRRMDEFESTPLQLDEESIDRVNAVTEAANKARIDLGQQVGLARVAIRDAGQATTNLRSAQSRGAGKKW